MHTQVKPLTTGAGRVSTSRSTQSTPRAYCVVDISRDNKKKLAYNHFANFVSPNPYQFHHQDPNYYVQCINKVTLDVER